MKLHTISKYDSVFSKTERCEEWNQGKHIITDGNEGQKNESGWCKNVATIISYKTKATRVARMTAIEEVRENGEDR